VLVVREHRVCSSGVSHHGLVRTLYDESPEILSYLEWTAPTKSRADVRGNFLPVPSAYAQGLPEMQTQHTCILLEDVIDHCNLRCPTCFTESSPALGSVAPLDQVLESVDTRLSRENGRIDVVMLSGGEPTLYPQLAELLDALRGATDRADLVNTSGIRLDGRRAARAFSSATGSAWRSPPVRRPVRRRLAPPPGRGPPAEGPGGGAAVAAGIFTT
jgi:hypothetical protein